MRLLILALLATAASPAPVISRRGDGCMTGPGALYAGTILKAHPSERYGSILIHANETLEDVALRSVPHGRPSSDFTAATLLSLNPLLTGVDPGKDRAQYGVYEAKAGDTAWGIAGKNHLYLSQLLELNPQISDPENLSIGEKFIVPFACETDAPDTRLGAEPGLIERSTIRRSVNIDCDYASGTCTICEYQVQRGDTLQKIAKRLHISYPALLNVPENNIRDPDYIFPGEVLDWYSADRDCPVFDDDAEIS